MTTNITTLALNLLISERLSHRNLIATQIISLVDALNERSEKSRETKQAFVALIHQCISNPNCQFRDLFFRYAEYYGRKLKAKEKHAVAA